MISTFKGFIWKEVWFLLELCRFLKTRNRELRSLLPVCEMRNCESENDSCPSFFVFPFWFQFQIHCCWKLLRNLNHCSLKTVMITGLQSCAEKRNCFAKHQPGVAGCGWLQQKLSLNLAPFLLLNPVVPIQSKDSVIANKLGICNRGRKENSSLSLFLFADSPDQFPFFPNNDAPQTADRWRGGGRQLRRPASIKITLAVDEIYRLAQKLRWQVARLIAWVLRRLSFWRINMHAMWKFCIILYMFTYWQLLCRYRVNGGHSCFPFSFSCTQKLWLLHAIKSAWLNEISLQQWSQNLPSWGACSFISPGNFQIYWDTCSLVNPAANLEGVNCFWAWVVLAYPTTDRDRTELSKKVCPRLRDRATAPAGGITQHRTNCFGELCRFPLSLSPSPSLAF